LQLTGTQTLSDAIYTIIWRQLTAAFYLLFNLQCFLLVLSNVVLENFR